MIEGFYGVDLMGSDSDYYLAPIDFPMTETVPDPDSHEDLAVDITNEQELQAWADVNFAEHNIFEMEVPAEAVVKEDLPYPEAAGEAAENVARAVVALYPHRDSLGAQRDVLDGIRDELLSAADPDGHTCDEQDPEAGCVP